jgi:hypothetical protein
MKVLFCLLFVLKFLTCFSQEQDINFVITNIEQNYSPLRDKSEKIKFENYYHQIFSNYKDKETFWKLSKIVNYFNNRHLVIYDTTFLQRINKNSLKDTLNKITNSLERQQLLKYEGFWMNDYNNCVIGLKKVGTNPTIFKGYVIEANNHNLIPGMICCEFVQQRNDNYYTNYTSTVGKYRTYINSRFINDSTIITASYNKWKKIEHYTTGYLNQFSKYNTLASFKKINDKFFLIAIPECSKQNVLIVDSLTNVFKNELEKCETIIIDIRNNGGGTARVYYPLLPFIYTQPIKTVSGYVYSSEGGIKDYEQSLDNYLKSPVIDSNVVNAYRNRIIEMKACIGDFILTPGRTITFDTIKAYPKNVAIITNYGSLSAAELMILDFRQSKKVKIFGENSGGAVDFLDYYPTISPINKYWLYIPKTQRILTKEQPNYDRIGISPDIKISNSEKDWVKFVQNYYEK